MKKIAKILFIVIIAFITTACHSNESKIKFVNDNGHYIPDDITYSFTGISEHFGFSTGKVYYGDNGEKYIYISNFNIINKLKNEKNIKSYLISLNFNNKPMFSNELELLNDLSLEEKLNNFSIEESGNKSLNEYGESDSFLETTKENFKKSIKMEIKYCYENSNCQIEKFKINYIDN